MAEGYLDTNVFVHAYAHDPLTAECVGLLKALQGGRVQAALQPVVLHELSYVLPRFLKQMTRQDVADYLLMVLGWDGVREDKDVMVGAVQRWRSTPGLGFVDAYLAALAVDRGRVVYTKNVLEFERQGVLVPRPLPSA